MLFVDTYEQGITVLGPDIAKYPENFYCFEPLMHGRFSGVYHDELRHFVDCIKMGTKPIVGANDGYNAVAVAEALETSLRSGREEKVAY